MKTFDDEMIQKARNAKSAEELLAFANDDNYKMTAEEANIYYAQLNPKGGELSDNELDNVSGGGCSTSITVFYDDGMIGKRAYHPTSGNTYTILGSCPDDPTKALVRNQYSGDEGYAPLAILVIE